MNTDDTVTIYDVAREAGVSMATAGIADARTKKFLRDQPLEKMTSGKILPLKPKRKKGRNHFTRK